MSNLREFSGQENLVPALEALTIGDAKPDMVVVRDFIGQEGLRKLRRSYLTPSAPNSVDESSLRQLAPSLADADRFVAEQWETVGYNNIPHIGPFVLDQLRRDRGIKPHIDEPIYEDLMVEAIAQGSLCLSGERIFKAERKDAAFKNRRGNLNLRGFKRYIKKTAPDWDTPRTRATLAAGDLALFAHHPAIVLHAVERVSGKPADAQLITWQATKLPRNS